MLKARQRTGESAITLGDQMWPNSQEPVIEPWPATSTVFIGVSGLLPCPRATRQDDNLSNILLAENVFISDVDHTWSMPGLPIHQQPNKQSDTEIGKNCFLGYGCVILAGTKLGEGVIVGASSVVRGEYDCGSIVAGSPAKIIKLRDGYSSKER